MTVYFHNPGNLDLDTIRLMGVSVKENENPIGYFGTGLKFAIATLLRTGHEIVLETAGKSYTFTSRQQTVRGKAMQVVYMNDEQLGFTVDLGKNWEPWMAFRELHSNAMDEGGGSCVSSRPANADTIISVSGAGIMEAWSRRSRIFLQSSSRWIIGNVEVHPEPSNAVFYRGVVAQRREKPFAFTYNILSELRLTEDRTVASEFMVDWEIRKAIESDSAPLEFLQELFPHRGLENGFHYTELTDQMKAAARPHVHDLEFNSSIREMIRDSDGTDNGHKPSNLGALEEVEIQTALNIVKKLDSRITRETFIVTDSLGPRIYGVYNCKRDEIYISRQCLDRGTRFFASVVYEEWLHKMHGYEDYTREMQDFLFDKLMSTISRLPE